jgi:hypothetical protein
MENESEFRRPRPTSVYRPSTTQLTLPRGGLVATLEMLLRSGRRECGLFWYGTRAPNGNAEVSHVMVPRQYMSWGNYHVDAQSLAEVVQQLPPEAKPLAQVHSHPGTNVEHSIYDDEMMSSRKALSIVFPRYGQVEEPFPAGVGIHEWQTGYWHLLEPAQAGQRVLLAPGDVVVKDLR